MAPAVPSDPVVLAIDQGTTNTKALLVRGDGQIMLSRSRCVPLAFPQSGWVEQSAEDIWTTVVDLIAEVCAAAPRASIAALAISNQRETVLLWDRHTGKPLAPAVTWQCRRSADRCAALRADGHEVEIASLSGLGIDPLFPAAKIGWMLDHIPDARTAAARGDILAGTIDSWLLWKLTGGTVHATDTSNASRTQLFNLDRLTWDERLAELFDIPLSILPKVMPSDSLFGTVQDACPALPAGTPVRAMMGDSHAALFAHDEDASGTVKVTIGTGSSLMVATPARARSTHGLSGTVAWSRSDGGAQYALEGNITVSGHAASFMAKMMGLAGAAALSELAGQVDSSDGVIVVPALAGLGAPHWQTDARGTITGMTLGTMPTHLARATLEGIAHQICDVIEAMEADLGQDFPAIAIDGGGSESALLAQMLADFSGKTIISPASAETSALGAARMAALATGIAIGGHDRQETRYHPALSINYRKEARNLWRAAIARLIAAPAGPAAAAPTTAGNSMAASAA
jgi:glycerol kinase